ncbi:Ig-like domain-containing protein [Streptomyces sp. LX-29]|uniref:L,D-transpeptidase n=1 Tax=Streptomyces sp. LX-29 TaxID=2900152 RepID=UPI00240D4938|nr:Ig-like domain-containing protein [Streptomyces sp. LX-29]WFB08695.1 Ig-like domain-containing protein [Streptomyces sp. LX-29]
MRSIRPIRRPLRLLAASSLALASLVACQSSSGSDGKGGASVDPADAKPARITVTPGSDGPAVAPDGGIKVDVAGGTLTKVQVTPDPSSADAVAVTGSWSDAKKSWRSTRTMTPGASYAVLATATNAAGEVTTHRSAFRTRAAKVFNGVSVTPSNNKVVGAGQPVSIAFDHPVKDKAAVERRLSVSTSPKTEGSWGWTRDPLTGVERVDWRPESYWAKGTKVTLRAKLSGVNTGEGRYLRRDVSSTFTVGTVRVAKADLKQHTMTVYEDGKKVDTIPVSAGSTAYPTWNGTMVVLGKAPMVNMTSESVNIADPYNKDVPWAVHLTTSGTYAHAAPWNEGKGYFGRVNMSHGCIGMSEADGKSFYDRATPGDIIEVTGSTRETVATGNGYGDWNLSYEEWKKLSALD